MFVIHSLCVLLKLGCQRNLCRCHREVEEFERVVCKAAARVLIDVCHMVVVLQCVYIRNLILLSAVWLYVFNVGLEHKRRVLVQCCPWRGIVVSSCQRVVCHIVVCHALVLQFVEHVALKHKGLQVVYGVLGLTFNSYRLYNKAHVAVCPTLGQLHLNWCNDIWSMVAGRHRLVLHATKHIVLFYNDLGNLVCCHHLLKVVGLALLYFESLGLTAHHIEYHNAKP